MKTFPLCVALIAVVVAASAQWQPRHTSEGGLGWDGSHYVELTRQCWRQPMRSAEPFVYRIGAPCLAALLPAPPELSLRIVDTAAAILLIFLIAAWLERHVPPSIAGWLVAAFALHWLTPLRQVWWYPTYIDPPAMCAMVGVFLLRDRPIGLALVAIGGGLIRESTIVAPLSLLLGQILTRAQADERAASWWADRRIKAGLFGSIGGVAAVALTHAVVTPGTDYWMLDAAKYWAKTKPPAAYLLAWFIAFGPALVLLAVRRRDTVNYLLAAPEYLVFTGSIAVLGWIGGSDTERFLLWGSPIVLVLIGFAASRIEWSRARGALVLLAIAQAINGRWFLVTPDYGVTAPRVWPVLTSWTARGVELILSQNPDRLVINVALAEYLLVCLIIAGWLKMRHA